jgi:hypothetical protein
MTTTTTDDYERMYQLRAAMCALRSAHGPRGRTHAHGQGHRARARRDRPRDHARLPARQRRPLPQSLRLPGPRHLRRRLARRTTTDDYERMYQLRAAMCALRTDPVGGRTRMVKAIAREHGETDHEITRAYLRVSAGLYPKACDYQDLDAYAAAWRDAPIIRPRPITYSVWCSGAASTRRASSGGMAERPPRRTPRRARSARGGATPSACSATGRCHS